ncbi:MAG TPA: bifunctional adenosylcobinamide kinase/adenosylcobinamide-phosphate guanylyltransferase [Thermodesulfobacteriota bacterium]|nr:bifunctional adenosylcobinamide kinase/adenosylcobinamide-phosphate guanylyltransferase [Thermodesulfobacteriota bacterium]
MDRRLILRRRRAPSFRTGSKASLSINPEQTLGFRPGKVEGLILVTGGCRSGKSQFALDYANRHFHKKLYLATCEALDEEMAKRIEDHKKKRGMDWQTVEEPIKIAEAIEEHGKSVEVVLLDCVTLWLSNLLMRQKSDHEIVKEVSGLIDTVKQSQASIISVSNEVGMGLVPVEPLGRRFRDLAGMANQKIAEVAQTVIFMVSGIPMFLKGKE